MSIYTAMPVKLKCAATITSWYAINCRRSRHIAQSHRNLDDLAPLGSDATSHKICKTLIASSRWRRRFSRNEKALANVLKRP